MLEVVSFFVIGAALIAIGMTIEALINNWNRS